MFNHNRGLWGYTGTASDGEPLTIMSHGIGGPSAAIVLEELCDLGLELVVRVGTCGALVDGLVLGDLIAVTAAIPADGTSAALGATAPLAADPRLTDRLAAAADHTGTVVSTDLFYDPDPARPERWRAAGALAVEMEAATVLAVAARRGVRAACLLAVTDTLPGAGERIGAERARGRLTAPRSRGARRAARRRRLSAVSRPGASAASSWRPACAARASWRRACPARAQRCRDLAKRGLHRGKTLFQPADAVRAGEPLVQAVDGVLDPLEPLAHRAQAACQPLQVRGRGQVERAHRGLLRL